MTRAENEAPTPSGRVRMKEQALLFAERLTPKRMAAVAKGKERSTDREVDVIAFPGVEFKPGPNPLYVRRMDNAPPPRPAVRRNRFGKIVAQFIMRPTAPLRRVR